MTHNQVLIALQRAISAKHKVQILREEFETRYWNGYPLALSGDLVLLRTLDDFVLDGFAILRLKDITSVRHGPAERFFDHVLREEGLLNTLPPTPPVRLDSWRSALEDLRRHYQHVIIECEQEPMFYIGTLLNVGPKKVALRYFRIEGVIEHETTLVPLKEITLLRFEEQYLQYFAKYSRPETPS